MTSDELFGHISDFIRHLQNKQQASVHTILAYKRDLLQVLRHLERTPAAQATHLGLKQVLERHIACLYTQKITKSSIARKVSCLQTFATFLKSRNIDLAIEVKRPSFDQNMSEQLSTSEIAQLLANSHACATGYPARDRAIFALLYETGMRCSEIVSVRVGDLDPETKTVRISGAGKRARSIQCGSLSFSYMHDYISAERRSSDPAQSTLFLNHIGQPLTCRSIQRIIAAFRAIVPQRQQPITPHTLRISRAQHLLARGADLATVQEFLGHNTRTSTERYLASLSNHAHKNVPPVAPISKKTPHRPEGQA